MTKDLKDLLFDLSFHADYDREKQIERLNAHLEKGETISSFLYSEAERNLDNQIQLAHRAHDALKELIEQSQKPLWQRILKK